MAPDLGDLLRDTAVEPSQPVDASGLVARGRRRRTTRRAALATGTVVVVLAAVALVAGPLTSTPDEELVAGPQDSPATEPSVTTSTEPEAGPPTTVSGWATIGLEEVGRPLLVYGEAGISTVDGDQQHLIWDQPVARAHRDPDGGVVYQEPGEWGAIGRLSAGATSPEILVPSDERPHLHGIVELDGEATMLFTRRVRDAALDEHSIETLYALGLRSGRERELAVTGGQESGLDAATIVDGRLATSECHLQCVIRLRPTDDPDDEGDVLVPTDWISGLDAAGPEIVFVRHVGSAGGMDALEADLVRQHTTTGAVRVVRLTPPLIPTPVSFPFSVDLLPDTTAAIVHFPGRDHSTEPVVRADPITLLVDQLDGDPRVRRLDTTQGVSFL